METTAPCFPVGTQASDVPHVRSGSSSPPHAAAPGNAGMTLLHAQGTVPPLSRILSPVPAVEAPHSAVARVALPWVSADAYVPIGTAIAQDPPSQGKESSRTGMGRMVAWPARGPVAAAVIPACSVT